MGKTARREAEWNRLFAETLLEAERRGPLAMIELRMAPPGSSQAVVEARVECPLTNATVSSVAIRLATFPHLVHPADWVGPVVGEALLRADGPDAVAEASDAAPGSRTQYGPRPGRPASAVPILEDAREPALVHNACATATMATGQSEPRLARVRQRDPYWTEVEVENVAGCESVEITLLLTNACTPAPGPEGHRIDSVRLACELPEHITTTAVTLLGAVAFGTRFRHDSSYCSSTGTAWSTDGAWRGVTRLFHGSGFWFENGYSSVSPESYQREWAPWPWFGVGTVVLGAAIAMATREAATSVFPALLALLAVVPALPGLRAWRPLLRGAADLGRESGATLLERLPLVVWIGAAGLFYACVQWPDRISPLLRGCLGATTALVGLGMLGAFGVALYLDHRGWRQGYHCDGCALHLGVRPAGAGETCPLTRLTLCPQCRRACMGVQERCPVSPDACTGFGKVDLGRASPLEALTRCPNVVGGW
jgi:hypothetical protein